MAPPFLWYVWMCAIVSNWVAMPGQSSALFASALRRRGCGFVSHSAYTLFGLVASTLAQGNCCAMGVLNQQ